MAAEIKLTKTDESPWGFRLTGGRDFGTPLTIIKVAGHSVAEEAGLQVGDILVKINNEDCHDLTHKEAQDTIIGSGNTISFAVLRGSLNLPGEIIDRLTPLPLRDFKTPEPNHPLNERVNLVQNDTPANQQPPIEIIPIKDLEPELLEELGLNPLPEDFLELAKRDPSPMPEVRPQSSMTGAPDVIDALENLGLQTMVEDIERQKPEVFAPPPQIEEVCTIPQQSDATVGESSAVEGDAPQPLITSPESSILGTPNEPSQKICPLTECPCPVDQAEPCCIEPISEEEFAEFMSGKTELVENSEGKNALGVDFKKYEPQAEFLRKSQVFKTLQDNEVPVTKEEKEKRWTTFLDKPRGPKPIPKPKSSPFAPTPEPVPEPIVEPPVPEPAKGLYEIPSEEEFEALIRVPTPAPVVEEICPEASEEVPVEENNVKQLLEEEQKNLLQQLDMEKQLNPEMFGEEKSEIELQLEEIQRQLQAIQQLPFEIQQHLALVQEQLNKIVQHRLHEQTDETPPCPRPSMVEESDAAQIVSQRESLPPLEESTEDAVQEQILETSGESQIEEQPSENQELDNEPKEFKLRAEEPALILPPPKKEKPQKKRPFMGLGPAPRPLILPGGRRWRTPKDAYNDEFIAETLSAQAEIITGHTLGVNFRKYEPKLPNLEHLRDSITYKMIHDLEDPEISGKGLAARAEIVPALQDYNQQSAPAAI